MTEWYLAESLQEISPELVMEASLPLRRKKSRNFLAFAACFALVTICSFALNNLGMGGASMGADSAAPEMGSAAESITDDAGDHSEHVDSSSSLPYVIFEDRPRELVSFDLQEMYDRSDTVVIGHYSTAFDTLTEGGATLHLYEFCVEDRVKGSAAETITVRLPVLREINGTIENENYRFLMPETMFFDPTEDGKVMLFLQDCGNGIYRKAQEPFTVSIAADGKVTLRSNLLLPDDEKEALSTIEVQLESGHTLVYTDNTLLRYNGSGFSGQHINDILELLGSDLRILY